MEEKILLLQRSEHVGAITLNRPEKRNSLSSQLLLELKQALEDFARDDSIHALVITGAGDKSFCSGFDLGELPAPDATTENAASIGPENFEETMEVLINFPYPTIAMINGHAYGAGCDLAIGCDIRIAVDDVKMGIVPAKIGVVYSISGLRRFTQVVGLSKAKELFFTGSAYQAKRLQEMGLINYLVGRDNLKTFTYEMAEAISANAPLSLKGIKRSLNLIAEAEVLSEEALEENRKLMAESFMSEDIKEGRDAIFQKRKPVFKGV